MAKDGAEGKEMREQFGYDAPKEPEKHGPTTRGDIGGSAGQTGDKTGTPSATPQWPSSQPNRGGK